MDAKKSTIRIESINGGMSPSFWGGTEDQFQSSNGIQPDAPLNASLSLGNNYASRFLVPTKLKKATGLGTIADAIAWLVAEPKNSGATDNLYAYDVAGSVYTIGSGATPVVTGLGDLNDGGSANGNGCAYYDNYMYFARDTTIARYGPLNGTEAFTDDYWVGTLGLTALGDNQTAYGNMGYGNYQGLSSQSHMLYPHKDGRLYIADYSGGQGFIHFIKTTKTTVEGDTNEGSTYNALDLPYGWYPVAMCGYGDSIAIAINVYALGDSPSENSKVILWDGSSSSPNLIIDKGITDTYITAIINKSSELFIFACPEGSYLTRILRYVGGEVFQLLKTFPNSLAPRQGGVAIWLENLIWSGSIQLLTTFPTYAKRPSIMSMDKDMSVFQIGTTMNSTSSSMIQAIYAQTSSWIEQPNLLYTSNDGGSSFLVEQNIASPGGENSTSEWTSRYYPINKRFKVKKIRFSTPDKSVTGITPYIYTDNYSYEYTGASSGLSLASFSSPNFVEIRPVGVEGFHGFCLRFVWELNTTSRAIGLPIDIEIETYDD